MFSRVIPVGVVRRVWSISGVLVEEEMWRGVQCVLSGVSGVEWERRY